VRSAGSDPPQKGVVATAEALLLALLALASVSVGELAAAGARGLPFLRTAHEGPRRNCHANNSTLSSSFADSLMDYRRGCLEGEAVFCE
jgi:hypothetical protein